MIGSYAQQQLVQAPGSRFMAKTSISKALKASADEDAIIRAIIGEAANQGVEGMTAVGEVIRNRGNSLKGIFGADSPMVAKQPQWVFDLAKQAWKASEKSNLTGGATHWENVEAFGVPYWAEGMQQTSKIKNHTFFRRK